jgi:hypothetical protein
VTGVLLHFVLAAWQRHRDRRRGDLPYTTAVKLSISLGWKNECIVCIVRLSFVESAAEAAITVM